MTDRPRSPERQLVLNLPHRPAFGREDFLVTAANAAAVALIDRWPEWLNPVLLLVGPAGSGKSHLTEVWRMRSGARRCDLAELSLATMPSLLDMGAIVVEDVDRGPLDERLLFHLVNIIREAQGFAVLTSRSNPLAWRIGLKDLASRLQAMPMAVLHEPDDDLLRGLLVKLFADRQIAVDEAVISFMVARMERSAAAAGGLVAAIDRRSLEEKAEVTRNFVAKVLNDESWRTAPST